MASWVFVIQYFKVSQLVPDVILETNRDSSSELSNGVRAKRRILTANIIMFVLLGVNGVAIVFVNYMYGTDLPQSTSGIPEIYMLGIMFYSIEQIKRTLSELPDQNDL